MPRRAALVATVAALAVGIAVPSSVARPGTTLQVERGLAAAVLVQVNDLRRAHGLHTLTLSAPLSAVAEQHTRQMAERGYFAHDDADGAPFWKRIKAVYPAGSWRYWSVGENLLWSSPDVDAPGALKLWMASPEHRANLLAPRWREIGISALHALVAPGVYHGLDVTLVTTDFGVRR